MADLGNPFYVPETPLFRRKSSFDSSAISAPSIPTTTSSPNGFQTYNSLLLGPNDSLRSGRRPSIGTVSLFGMDIINTSMLGGQFVPEDKVDSMFNFEPPNSFEDLHVHFNLESIQEEHDKSNTASNTSVPPPPASPPAASSLRGVYQSEYNQNGYLNEQHQYSNGPLLNQQSGKRPNEFGGEYAKRTRVEETINGNNSSQTRTPLFSENKYLHTVSPAAMHHQSHSHAAFLEDMAASAAEGNGIEQHIPYQNYQQIPSHDISNHSPNSRQHHQIHQQFQPQMQNNNQLQHLIHADHVNGITNRTSTPFTFNVNQSSVEAPMPPARPQSTPIGLHQYVNSPHYQYQQFQSQQIQSQQIPINVHGQYQMQHNVQYAQHQVPVTGVPTPTAEPKAPTPKQPKVRASSPGSNAEGEDGDGERQKKYKCPKAWCSKIYKNSNGLKYHMEHGNCELDYTSLDGAKTASTFEFDVNGNPTSNPAGMPGGLIKVTHRPYCCKVANCGKRYKNLNGLKYHGKVSHPNLDFRSMVKGHSPSSGNA